MFYLLGLFIAYIAISSWYIHKLNVRIRSFEQDWMRIEELSDHNKDGDVVIHVKHIEENHDD